MLHFKGESWGWLAQIYLDGTPLGGHRFMLRADAVQWAEEERHSFENTNQGD
jgi:hypothetical protein